jgi:mannose-1-phosphate guanylyltransferase
MKVILLAAGFGTRLRPLTNNLPKCLVPIKGNPLLQIWLENLVEAGLNTILINTHYLPLQVEDFINKSKFKDKCILKYEENLLGTAGTLLANANFINDEDCMLIHADNYCLADINLFIKAHNNRPNHCLMSMMTFRTDNPSSCGIVEIDKENVVIGFHEKVLLPPGNLANGAVYILSLELLNHIRAKFSNAIDFSTQVLPFLVGRIYAYEISETFIDIGTPETYSIANSSYEPK